MNKPPILSPTTPTTPSTELFINAVIPQEIRIAHLQGGILQEIHIERLNQRSIVGNVYKGRVRRVLPGLQATFVDIGEVRPAFLSMADRAPSSVLRAGCPKKTLPSGPTPVSATMHAGQSLIVQVVRDPLGTKGAQLTTRPTLVGRYLILMPHRQDIRISQRIDHPAHRQRLTTLIKTLNTGPLGFMIRTAALTASPEALTQEITLLKQQWQAITEWATHASSPVLLYHAASLTQRIVRDLANDTLSRIVVDCHTTYHDLMNASSRVTMPEIADKLSLYQGPQPIFHQFNIENAIHQALSPRVALPSGGYLLIEQTTALTTIDVNTGKFTGRNSANATILQTNLEATATIAHQLRLRNLGGIIMIDFIDMHYQTEQKQVRTALQQALAKDRVKTTLGSFSPSGVLEMVRHRTRESLEKMICSDCPTCNGRGAIKTPETICYEILREILYLHHLYAAQQFSVHSSATINDALVNNQAQILTQIEATIGKSIRLNLKVEAHYQYEEFKVVVFTDGGPSP